VTLTMILLPGLMGASGIVLAAAAAHTAPGAGLDSAAYMLMFHATAVLSGTALFAAGSAAAANDDARFSPGGCLAVFCSPATSRYRGRACRHGRRRSG
jgi:uncharacterized membrane protein YgdD (TMEM256/DUF423 family)